MAPYEDVHSAWGRLSRDSHIGLSDALRIVAAVAIVARVRSGDAWQR
jgi:hypothetical protein